MLSPKQEIMLKHMSKKKKYNIPNISIYNHCRFVGRLRNTPVKRQIKKGVLTTYVEIITKYGPHKKTQNQKYSIIPIIFYGQDVDIICTKYKIGDFVAVECEVFTEETDDFKLNIQFVGSQIILLKTSNVEYVDTDRFRKVIKLYEPRNVTRRMNKW